MVKETFSPESLENCKFSVKLKNTNIYRSYITAPILKKGGHIEIWSSSLSLICENSFIYYLQHKGIGFIGFPLQHVPFSSFNMATILENGSRLEKWQPVLFFKWITYSSERVGSDALVCQIWCLYHQVKHCFSNLLY